MSSRLNLGCGEDYKLGWVNLDYNPKIEPDIVWDMNKIPLPFKNNTFSEILLNHVLEHFNEPLEIINELWRIGKNGCRIIIRVPHWSCYYAYSDLTHRSFYTSRNFMHFNNDDTNYYNKNIKFRTKSKLNFRSSKNKLSNAILNPILNNNLSFTENFLCKFISIYEVEYELEVIK